MVEIEINYNDNNEASKEYLRILNLIYGIKSLHEVKFKDNNIFNLKKDNIIILNNP